VDVCVVTYRDSADRVADALRPHDRLFVRDNTLDNIGFAAGANAAAARGSDPLIAFVNPDCLPASGCFDALERAMEDPGVVAVEATPRPSLPGHSPDSDGHLKFVYAACLAVRRDAFEAVGGFDARLFMYYEDVDLSYRLARHGTFRMVPDAVFEHDAKTRPWRAQHRLFRNYLVVERRHGRRSQADLLVQLARDAVGAARLGYWVPAAGRLTGAADYLWRGWRWVDRPRLIGTPS
jgi:GT2 family glycosyltransferase